MSTAPELVPRAGAAGGTTEELRRSNLARILGFIHREGALSRAELTRLTALNRSTIGTLVGELRDLGLVTETLPDTKSGTNPAGRPSPIVHPSSSVVAVAVNPEVDAIHVGLVALGGRVLERMRIETHGVPSSRDAVELTRDAISGLLDTAAGLTVVGVGLAVPGLVRLADGQVRVADHMGWFNEPLAEMVQAATGLKVSAANAAQLGMRAEGVFGAGRGVDDLVYLIGGASGIGGGVITGGRLLVGADGYASEFGHTFVKSNGASCPCGAHGCFEAEVRQEVLLEAVGLPPSGAAQLAERLARTTDPAVVALVEEYRALTRIAVKNAVNLFNPSLMVVSGFLAALFADDSDGFASLADGSITASLEGLRIVSAQLGADQLLLGAGELVFTEGLFDPVAGFM
ncbi:ROK family transcriptional regulator [Subtercola boreus]|uniref:XylR family transcriptional regulator n=1 Tax=Subtercola boreus TaxID=120213 RepID=A0A3E0WEY6_9MICO|nr:ROK family transcriptional regulator [Subtercola boreus]RFA22681.1 XylR family transcriptional regulator [Subtercola boreus]RFA23036.1 XylR family transcriptional regulator [Subtercola boreus]RFA28789.1 XylR family transcriptional regulator [Subtercola boreus]